MTSIAEMVGEACVLRRRAQDAGDRALTRAMDGELERLGVKPQPSSPAPMETATPAPMEKAVPPKPRPRGGRPKLPRCEHDRIVGRCADCDEVA